MRRIRSLSGSDVGGANLPCPHWRINGTPASQESDKKLKAGDKVYVTTSKGKKYTGRVEKRSGDTVTVILTDTVIQFINGRPLRRAVFDIVFTGIREKRG